MGLQSRFVGSFDHSLPTNTSAFAQSVRKISRMIDKRRQSSDSDSDPSSPGSSALHTQGADKAGLQPQSHGRISPLGFIGDETHRISVAQEGNAQRLASNAQTYEPMEFNIRKYPRDSAEDEDDLLSSPRGSRTQRYAPKPQNDDASQSQHSHNHPMGYKSTDTLMSMANLAPNLASTYWNQGRKEAEELFVKVVETMRTVLGAEHPDTLMSMANPASTYRNQGRWKEAEELEVKVVKMHWEKEDNLLAREEAVRMMNQKPAEGGRHIMQFPSNFPIMFSFLAVFVVILAIVLQQHIGW